MDFAFGDSPGGSVYVELLDADAPNTVSNFLNYVENANGDRRYDGIFVHRSVPGFIIQGGGYAYDPALGAFGTTSAPHIPEDPPVANEFDVSRSNVRGTIAMAKLGGDPDSATSEWFFNLADNSANLDNQNGGFTVFGRVLGNGMDVVDAIAGMAVVNQGGVFASLPVVDAAGPVDISNLIVLTRVVVNPPGLSVDPADQDFRLVALNSGPATAVLTVQNFGVDNLVIGNIGGADSLAPPFRFAPSGDACTGVTLVPGGTCTLTIEFEPTVLGDVQDSFNIPSNDVVLPDLTVSVRGSGAPETPVLELSPSAGLDFGSTGTGEPKQAVVTVRNVGGGQLAPSTVAITGLDAGAFSVSDNACSGTVLAINDTCSISVTLLSGTAKTVAANLQVSADPGGQSAALPLSGNVTALQSQIGFPVSVEMGDTQVDQTITAPVTITNSGVDDLYISAIELVGNQASLFSGTATCLQAAAAPGASCTEQVSFTSSQTGEFAATLRVSSNDPNNPVIDIPVRVTVSEDGDGIPDAVERAGPHGGDGNQDGIQDNVQDRVASLLNINGQYVTLEAAAGTQLKNVKASASPSPSNTPTASGATLEFQQGFFAFSIENVPVGGAATVTLHLPDGQGANSYFKFGRFPTEPPFLFPEHWYDFVYDPQSGTGAEFSGNRVVLHFVDGGRGDNDQLADGRISDPGGPAIASVSGGSSSGGGGCSMVRGRPSGNSWLNVDLVLMLIGLVVVRTWQRGACRWRMWWSRCALSRMDS